MNKEEHKMKQQEYYVTLKLKIESDLIKEEDLLTKEEIDEKFKKEFDCIFESDYTHRSCFQDLKYFV